MGIIWLGEWGVLVVTFNVNFPLCLRRTYVPKRRPLAGTNSSRDLTCTTCSTYQPRMFIYRLFVWPYRCIRYTYRLRPLASDVVSAYLRQRNYPTWTSFFLPYRFVQDDLFGEKHINFPAGDHNYHLLRIGCFPYVKYHLTRMPWTNLYLENFIFKLITVVNLGLPCLVYGIAAFFLIRHTEHVVVRGVRIPLHFLIREEH